jgi:hypothetical protein
MAPKTTVKQQNAACPLDRVNSQFRVDGAQQALGLGFQLDRLSASVPN